MRAILKSTSVAASLLSSLAFAATPGVRVGTFAPGESVTAPEQNAPRQVSRAAVKTVLPEGGKARVSIAATGEGSLLVWTLPHGAAEGSDVSSSLRTPRGRALRAGERKSEDADLRRFAFEGGETELELSARQEVIHIARAEAGVHTLEIESEAKAFTVVSAEPESRLTLATWAGPLSRQPGEPVTLYAQLQDGDASLSRSARVTARLLPPGATPGEPVELFDDGRHGDGAAGDGLYALTLASLPNETPGFWSVRFEAEGVDGSERPFSRTGGSGFVAERGAARLLPGSVKAEVVGEALRVSVTPIVNEPGDYRLDVIVSGAENGDGSRAGLAWGELTQSLAKGRTPLVVDIPLSSLGDVKGLHLDVRLLGLDTIGLAGRAELEVTR